MIGGKSKGYFRPQMHPWKKPFVISMPPPNVTGQLHLGHAITATLEDIMIRYHRLIGDPTLWVPGADHAGIATQNVVERELAKEGHTRLDLGREKFVERVWEWKEVYLSRITNQHRSLGVSCDWERERFTLDEGLSHAVRTAFVQLYEKGPDLSRHLPGQLVPALWDGDLGPGGGARGRGVAPVALALPGGRLRTGPARRRRGPIPQWCAGAQAYITVATTRPETLLGDSAVAVHPEDERYADLIGKTVMLPGVERPIPIVADEAVEREFGTGAVKVTPAHDPTDYEIGKRHKLAEISVMTDHGQMNENAGPYAGQDRFACRKQIVADLEATGTLVKIEPYSHSVGHCQRCATVIEPRISTQWFVKIKPLADPAVEAVRDGRIRIVPERFEKVYYNWMENIRDWCISRQLWWGHRIPVWYCQGCGHEFAALEDPTACPSCGSAELEQEEDVLDTWFSSGLWPFSTLGWPEETPDFKYFYPTSVLETGYDILFFWVARMIMLGLECTGEVPFHTVYLHGLVRNERGQKISKSLPDAASYDPLNVIQEYGCDALRFALVTSSTPGNDTKLSPTRIEAARNFANKIWNATRFVLSNLDGATPVKEGELEPGRAPAGRPLDRQPQQPPDRRGEPPDGGLPVWRGRAAAPGVPVERVLRLVHRDVQGAPVWRDDPQAKDAARTGAGLRAGALAAPAASLYALCHRGALAGAAARGRGADRRFLARRQAGGRRGRGLDAGADGRGARHPQRARRVRRPGRQAHPGGDGGRRPDGAF